MNRLAGGRGAGADANDVGAIPPTRNQATLEPRPVISPSDITFVLCTESNRLAAQSVMLCESIRRFAGEYSGSPIVTVSPRASLCADQETVARLRSLGAEHVAEPLNSTGSPYGSINRIVVGSWAEANLTTEYLVVLDTDTVFVAPPVFVHAAVGLRPVDGKGAASAGPSDPLDQYWSDVAALADMPLDRLPWVHPTVEGGLVRASYNGGFCVARRDVNVLTRTAEIFFESMRRDLRPLRGRGIDVYASTGSVGVEASEWWGSSQAALAVAAWSATDDVYTYDSGYNMPMHLLALDPQIAFLQSGDSPVLLHYHWLTEPPRRQIFSESLVANRVGDEARAWINGSLAMFD